MAQGKIAAAGDNFRVAAKKDPKSWQVWLDLALATNGTERRHALAIAERLNPRDPTIPALARQQLIFPGV